MKELMESISRLSWIPFEHLIVLKRNPKISITGVDILSAEKEREKKLSKLRINDGVNLFFEDGRFNHPDITEYSFLQDSEIQTKWQTEFELEKNRFTIKFNTPLEQKPPHPDDIPISQPGLEYDRWITLD